MIRIVRMLLVLGFFLPCALSQTLAAETLTSKSLGFEIKLPEDWVILSQDQWQMNLDQTKSLKEDLEEKLSSHRKSPVFVATRFPEPYPDINPNVKVYLFPFKRGKSRDMIEVAREHMQFLGFFARNAKPMTAPETRQLDGIEVAYASLQATLNAEGKEFPFISEAWFVPRSEFYLIVTIGYKPDGATGTRDAPAASVESMKLFREEL